MGILASITGGGQNNRASVTEHSELVVGPGGDSQFHLGVTIANNVAVNVLLPKPGQ